MVGGSCNFAMTSIGVTGHRSLRDPDLIISGIDIALLTIEDAFPRPFALFSSLAEGADQLVAERALSLLQARLIVPLPLLLEDYLTDFSQASARKLVMFLHTASEVVNIPPQPTRNAAYEAAGRYMLEHSGILIAVWDGQAARGQGGTGQMVAVARQLGLPIAWVLATNQRQEIEGKTGSVTLERFPEHRVNS